MHIGTVRPEEARIHDTWVGYHQFHAEETQAPYGSFEIFWRDKEEVDGEAGWYWWACQPGCLPDGEPSGPFATSRAALEDADEWHPEFDGPEVQETIIYLSDEAMPCQMPLRQLFDNFITSGTDYFQSDIKADLEARGYYHGTHVNGHYCIIRKQTIGALFPSETDWDA